jgi:hypothetical protein
VVKLAHENVANEKDVLNGRLFVVDVFPVLNEIFSVVSSVFFLTVVNLNVVK